MALQLLTTNNSYIAHIELRHKCLKARVMLATLHQFISIALSEDLYDIATIAPQSYASVTPSSLCLAVGSTEILYIQELCSVFYA